MLGGAEQALLRQLAVFPSRFTMTCVEELLSDLPQREISGGISRLVDLGLIQRTSSSGSWWRVLETVRAFAFQDLSAADKHAHAERHARWCVQKLGRFPDEQLDSLRQADWCLQHWPDLQAAEQFFSTHNNLPAAYAVCAGTGLMVQLDDGARAKEKLERAEAYLQAQPPPYWQARLHAIAGLCAQANRMPGLLGQHTEAYVQIARRLDDPELLANALLMQSLTTGFVDSELAHAQLTEMSNLARRTGNGSLAQSATCYHAWQFVMEREYSRGRALAEQLVDSYLAAPDHIDNPAYNAMGIIITCTVVDEPAAAARWAPEINNFPAVTSFWGIQNLLACVDASNGAWAAAAQRCLDIKARLNRANRDEFPDVLVSAILLAAGRKDHDRARLWLSAIRHSGVPIQMYHTIAIYRQLYKQLGFGGSSADTAPSLDDIRDDVEGWLRGLSEAGT